VPCCLHPGLGHQGWGAISRCCSPLHLQGIRPAARASRRQSESRCRPSSIRQLPALAPPMPLTSLEVAFGGPPPGRRLRAQDSRARTCGGSVHQGRWGCAEASSAASLGRASCELGGSGQRCEAAAVPTSLVGRPWPLPPGHGSQEPLGSRPAAGPPGGSSIKRFCSRVSRLAPWRARAGLVGIGAPAAAAGGCAPAGGIGPPAAAPRHLFPPAAQGPTTRLSPGCASGLALTGNLAEAGPRKTSVLVVELAGSMRALQRAVGWVAVCGQGRPATGNAASCAGNRSVTNLCLLQRPPSIWPRLAAGQFGLPSRRPATLLFPQAQELLATSLCYWPGQV